MTFLSKKIPANIQYGFTVEKKDFSPSLISQVHGDDIIEVSGRAHWETLRQLPVKADGVWTSQPEIELYVFSADCLPVLFFGKSPESPIAAVHSGWRGALQGIVKKTSTQLAKTNSELYAVLGPSILGCCFEVKEDFVQAFQERNKPVAPFLEKSRGRMFFDLPRYVREIELADIPEERLEMEENRCTYCSAPPLPSYRRNGGTDPRIRAWIRKRSLL